jgi:lambda repressor-like predicted transcriptional regulator
MLTPQTIKIALLEKDITGAYIARQAGVSRSAINHTIAGRRKSPRLRKAIADALGKMVSDFWPENDKQVA